MNIASAQHTADNWAVYAITAIGGFVTENWYEIGFLAFGAVHAWVAIEKWRYEKRNRAKKDAV